jgi:hypothetical protein
MKSAIWYLSLVLAFGGCSNMSRHGMLNEPPKAGGASAKTQQEIKLADVAYSQQQWPEAEKRYQRAVQLAPNHSYPWFKLGNIYVKTQRFEEAGKAYREALTRDPKHARALHNLALANLMLAKQMLEAGMPRLAADDSSAQSSRELLGELQRLTNTSGALAQSAQPSAGDNSVGARGVRPPAQPTDARKATMAAANSVQANPGTAATDSDGAADQLFEVRARALLVRDEPATDAKVLHKLKQSERVQVADTGAATGKKWTKVVVAGSGVSGWVLANHLAMVSTN